MDTICFNLPTMSEVEFSLSVDFDETPVRGNAVASGDNDFDKRVEDEIIQRLENGDVWAWGIVTVSAKWKGHRGVDHLGACCYANKQDFKSEGGYWEDMKTEAYNDLVNTLKQLAE